nr:hypothetical protein GCM10020093_114540 [Planobispora longispora]
MAVLATQLLVPRIATWSAVYLLEDFDVRLAHAWHAEERHNEALRALLAEGSPPRPRAPGGGPPGWRAPGPCSSSRS